MKVYRFRNFYNTVNPKTKKPHNGAVYTISCFITNYPPALPTLPPRLPEEANPPLEMDAADLADDTAVLADAVIFIRASPLDAIPYLDVPPKGDDGPNNVDGFA